MAIGQTVEESGSGSGEHGRGKDHVRQDHQSDLAKAGQSGGVIEPFPGAVPGLDFALEELLKALQAMQAGDFSVRLPGNQTGMVGKISDTFNDIISTNQRMAQQLEHVGDVVGKQGRTRQRVKLASGRGAWGEMEIPSTP